MEAKKVNEIMKGEKLMQRLDKCSEKKLPTYRQGSISVYEGKLTQVIIAKNMERIRIAFPALDKGYFEVLTEMIIEEGFSDARLTDAVNHVLRTCVYPSPTIAQFLSFDKKIKLYTHHEIVMMLETNPNAFREFLSVRLSAEQDKPLWAQATEIKQFDLQLWSKL